MARQDEVERCAFLEGHAPDADVAATLVGRNVGAYTIERALGRGGMGTVWLARRTDGRFEGRAAVKFLNLALLGRAGAERFRQEGSILARLSHQNIARLIDAGIADGQPYLVLEYVEGEPIDAWCDAQGLGVEDRIRLFLNVLAAVAHAHDRLVLHRDLKCSNILVGPDGQPKLLDFGIAKLLEGDAASGQATELTSQAGRPFTPGYAAPEHVQGGEVTPATDVYALGITLFILLTGSHPIAEADAPLAQHLRLVAEGAVVLASQAAARAGVEVARKRGATPAQLVRALRGDVDNILGRALEKDPARRYPNAHALADDLRRHLEHEPVSARAGTLAYRFGRAVRRHRLAFATILAITLVLTAGVIGTAWEAAVARGERAQAIRERQRADREAQRANSQRDFAFRQLSRAEAVADLDVFLISEAAPNGKPFTAADLLARADRIVSRQEPASDANRVEMLIAIGRQYAALEDVVQSRRLLEQAYALSRKLDEPSTRAKAACALAVTLASAGEGLRAEAIVGEALGNLPDEPQLAIDRISCLLDGSEVARVAGDPGVAVDRSRAAEDLLARVGFPVGFLSTRAAMNLAEAYRTAGRLNEAAGAFRRAWERLVALGRDDTESAGTVLNNWAVTLEQAGRPLEAEGLLRKALGIGSAGAARQGGSPLVLNNLARVLATLNHFREAAALADRAYALAREGDDEVTVNQALLVRAAVYRQTGDLARAAETLNEVEPRLRRMLPPGHFAFARLESQHSLVAQARGDLAVARAAAERAISIANASRQGAWVLSELHTRRADVEVQSGRWEQARRDAERALEEGRALGEPNRLLGIGYLAMGQALRGLGDCGAEKAFKSAGDQLRASLGPSHSLSRMADRLGQATRCPKADGLPEQ